MSAELQEPVASALEKHQTIYELRVTVSSEQRAEQKIFTPRPSTLLIKLLLTAKYLKASNTYRFVQSQEILSMHLKTRKHVNSTSGALL